MKLPDAITPVSRKTPLLLAPSVPGERVEQVTTSRGARVRFLLSTPKAPIAIVLLFPGDTGNMRLSMDGNMTWGEKNFLVRTRHLFLEQGFIVAVVDAPSDRNSDDGLYGFRATSDHAGDIASIVQRLRMLADVPAWLVGTSRGTESAACGAAYTSAKTINGIVLTSSVTRVAEDSLKRPGCIFDIPLNRIAVPVLLVHHHDDACGQCPVEDLPRIIANLNAAPVVETALFAGGLPPVGDPCRQYHYHGFFGIEEPVIAHISDRIRLHAISRN